MRTIDGGNIGSIATIDAPPYARLAASVIAGAVASARRGNRRELDWLRHGPGFWWCFVAPSVGKEPEDIRAFAVDVVTDGGS